MLTCYIKEDPDYQDEGALRYAGRRRSRTVYGHHHKGKESLDINLLKAERHAAVPLPDHGLLQCDNDTSPEWVIYKYSTFHSVVGELNQILANNLVPNGDDGHLRTFTTLQWECELYNGRPKLESSLLHV